MPLNPPSYIGHDVWYSPDVYINQVAAALWQPPQTRGIPENIRARLGAMFGGEDYQFQGNNAQAANQGAAYTQKMVDAGLLTNDQANIAKSAKPSGADQSSPGFDNGKIPASNDTGGLESSRDFPSTMQISRNFTVGQLTANPYVVFPHWIPRGIYKNGNAGLTPGQLMANAKLLAVNVLDPIKDQFPSMQITSTIRPNQGNSRSQHILFQACDFQIPGKWASHYDVAVWCQNNVPFDQLLLEYQYGTSWIHISYASSPVNKGPYKVAVMNASTNQFPHTNGLVNMNSQFRVT